MMHTTIVLFIYYTLTNSSGVAIWKAFVFPHSQEIPPTSGIPVALDDTAIVLPGLLVALHMELNEIIFQEWI